MESVKSSYEAKEVMHIDVVVCGLLLLLLLLEALTLALHANNMTAVCENNSQSHRTDASAHGYYAWSETSGCGYIEG